MYLDCPFAPDLIKDIRKGPVRKNPSKMHCTSEKLGWKGSMVWLTEMLEFGEGCVKSQAAMWNAKGMNLQMFWKVLYNAFHTGLFFFF
jgi:hypothetical protein